MTQVTKGKMKPNQLKNMSLEQSFIAGPSKETGGLCSKPHEFPDGFCGRVSINKIWGEGHRMCDFSSDLLVVR